MTDNTELRATKWAELTQYHKLYSNVYWGWFSTIDKSRNVLDLPDKGIVENRNRFIEDYNISVKRRFKHGCSVKAYDKFRTIIRNQFWADHVEYYTTTSGSSVCVCSPYTGNGDNVEKALEAGFTKIYPLYANHATTLIMIIPR